MHSISTPPSAGGLASVAIALLFVAVVRLGHRSSTAPPGGVPAPPAAP